MSADYEIQMPSSYVLMDSEEMEYLDGGGIPQWTVKGAIYAVFCAVGIGTGIAARRALQGRSGKYLAKKALPSLARKLGLSMSSIIVGNLVNYLVNVIDPVGALVNKLDKLDGRLDGWVGGHGWTQWRGLSLSNW